MKRLMALSVWCWIATVSFLLSGGCSKSPHRRDQALAPGVEQGNENRQNQGKMNAGVGEAAAGEEVKKFDLNHDKKPDVWAYYKKGAHQENSVDNAEGLIRKEWDFNFDGKIDIRRYFGDAKEPVK